jgi:hypothetical protein
MRLLVSLDPAATVAEIEVPSSTYTAETLAIYVRSPATSTGTFPLTNLNIPLQGGSTLMVSFSSVGSAVLLIEDTTFS